MTVIPFTPKLNEVEKIETRTPLDAIDLVVSGISEGDTKPEGMIIVWNEHCDDGGFKLRYITGGDVNLAGVVGMLEIAKADLIE